MNLFLDAFKKVKITDQLQWPIRKYKKYNWIVEKKIACELYLDAVACCGRIAKNKAEEKLALTLGLTLSGPMII